MHVKRQLAWLLALLASAGLIVAAYHWAARQGAADELARGARQLQLMAPELESALDKFETLPYVVGLQENVAALLAHPGERARIDQVNRSLKAIQRQSKVGAIYLMDRDGNTIAASNWDLPLTFVGRNFGYRPYFHEALAGRAGRFYGIGSTTSEPGYFIAQPVMVGAAVRGVVAVKISLDEFERNWAGAEDTIVLADRADVVFLSNRPQWKYRSLHPLSAATQRELASTDQYARRTITPIDGKPAPHAARTTGRLGWRLMLFPTPGRVQRAAALWALAAALVAASATVAAWALYQRRRRLEERQAANAALQRAASELDVKLAERTALLRQANDDLEARYATLKQTEHVLRSTQDQLVQAGKLAMLGQMAAGVTHELNQPLAAIRAFADNARTFLERGQQAQASANLTHISDASARMGAIIGQLKGFARRSDAVATVDIAQSLAASAFLLAGEFKRLGVALALPPPQPLLITGDAVRIEQVFINLLRNALDAVDDAAVREVSVTLTQQDGYAVVRIADSGPGISDKVAAHLFEPFFTTKPSGKGLGLGLAISSSIVQAMNGRLEGSNRPAGGAQFEVRLPLPGGEND
ncbi:sensor histidine kinase [Massilia antarctica]|uniref:sensor histidine kinase n=1 Tax=Massilia antarctica TaxID=2765360 RepID=UPI0006BB8EA5|nr:ATP-binding protein [Massilia sp. H27-R4]MCY0911198.1 ATP-binding protein [Massilia sp. H27-R4]CUI05211.1 C4-dicarboxylate transport sensor protein dctB [Janthinobacterium sp. CG23_2]CUU28997.1 C4-dicarboxylate transport sensor protein dctB [Janthinobacterium sp. CG23_2]